MKRILLIAMIMACAAASAQVKRGDVNNDNSVNTADVVEIYNIIINGDKKIVTGVEKKYSVSFSDDMLKVADLTISYIDDKN